LIGAGIIPILLLLAVEPTKADLGFVLAIELSVYFALLMFTYFRFRDASQSAWWLVLMLVVFPIGPTWIVREWDWGGIAFAPSGLIPLIPVLIGWFARKEA
jgi:uncharacterized membrane protein YhaH (DUF805 family)